MYITRKTQKTRWDRLMPFVNATLALLCLVGFMALLIGAAGGFDTPLEAKEAPMVTITGTPLGIGKSFGDYYGSFSVVLLVGERYILAFCDSYRNAVSDAQALVESANHEGRKVRVTGVFVGNNRLQMKMLDALSQTVVF